MGSIRSPIGRRLIDERGVTLPELLVAMVIGLLVAGGGMVLLQVALRTQPQVSERAAQIQQGRVLIETVSRELRQGQSIEGASGTSLEIMTYVDSATCGGPSADSAILCRVSYECDGPTCTRTEHDGAGGGSTRQVASGLLGSSVFRYCDHAGCDLTEATHPTFVEIELAYPNRDGDEAITLADGVALRNYYVPHGSS